MPRAPYTIIQAGVDSVRGIDSAGGNFLNGAQVKPQTLSLWDLTAGNNAFKGILTYLVAYNRVLSPLEHTQWFPADPRMAARPSTTTGISTSPASACRSSSTMPGFPTTTTSSPCSLAKGIRGCSAIPSGSVGNSGFLSPLHIAQMYQAGWEISSHSVTHPSDMKMLTEAQAVAGAGQLQNRPGKNRGRRQREEPGLPRRQQQRHDAGCRAAVLPVRARRSGV